MVTALFSLTAALGSALLFLAQPMVARQALPTLGGSPAVWNSCMVFFQGAVLGGYLLAHGLLRPRGGRTPALWAAAFAASLAFLPLRLGTPATAPPSPLAWLWPALLLGIAVPAILLASASPLLQRWFADRTRGADPYFLYAAGNLGSLGALAAYPLLVEPAWTLARQAEVWSAGFLAWGILVLACAVAGQVRSAPRPTPGAEPSAAAAAPRPGRGVVVRWMVLAAIPASLLQGCTLFLTTDLASVPLLWVVPLAIYLVSYIAAFSRWGPSSARAAARVLPFLAVALLFMILALSTQPVLAILALHLVFLLAAGVLCHGRLAELRPPPEHLTRFYLALAAGGALGGAFNSLLAPLVFQSVAEYPLAIVAACLVLPARARARDRAAAPSRTVELARDLPWAVGVALLTLILGLAAPWLAGPTGRWREAVAFGLPAILIASLLDHPRRFSLALLLTFLAGFWLQGQWTGTRFRERNFFGITRVTHDAASHQHQIVHGNTIHGRQSLDPAQRLEPLAYYHREGPLGALFRARREGEPTGTARVGVIGLGAGSMAAYAQPGEDWTFFEIDPAVIRVAQDPRWFTFLQNIRTDRWRIIPGDARLQLSQDPGGFDVLVLDAFSSDAIPVHLLTREAIELYLSRLRPGGWLAAHISNRYLALEPVWAALARECGAVAWSADDTREDGESGKEASHWVLMVRTEEDLGRLPRQTQWSPAEAEERVRAWTDQRASLFEVFQWR